jgi:NAD(P)-dependent dehydrogenase (short-subunit alcohol dehydrogenase family)
MQAMTNTMTTNMTGKTVLITGATNGIGKIAALELSRMGATVCIVARNRSKGQAVLEEIRRETNNVQLELFIADLSSMADVRKLAQEFTAKHTTLDVLLNNAGAFYSERKLSADGLEMTFALNHMSYFLLTNLLLPTLKNTPNSRVVSVSSAAHTSGKLDFANLQGEQKFNGWKAYSDSKLENALFTFALARRLAGSSVTANCLHPGFVKTGFGEGNSGIFAVVLGIAKNLMAISVEAGAQTMIHLASSPDVAGVTGKYFDKSKIASSSAASLDQAVQEQLWAHSEKLAGLVSEA